MNKKGVEMVSAAIVTFVIILIVLAVYMYLFGKNLTGINNASSCKGNAADGYSCNAPELCKGLKMPSYGGCTEPRVCCQLKLAGE